MPAQWFLISRLVLLVLLGTVRAGPFSPRSNVTLTAPRPPPQPGGRTVEPVGGSPSSRLYEHTVEGGEKQVVFTHRINLPPSAGCGCPPGTEPPVPASEVQALKVRLEILEELVKGLKEQCAGGCCPAAAQAGTGQTDVRSLCSLHGVFDLSRCACSCESGWGGPTCSDPTGAGVPPSTPPSVSGSCPDDCNDQGRCVRGRCVCFPGYSGPSCGWPSCPGDCNGRGRCVQGVCVCRAGFSGDDCSQRSCPRGCSQRGRCEDGRCVCDPGYAGEDCGKRSCPRGCSQRGRCENGRCVCDPGYTGDDCGVRSCPRGCSQRGRCEDGRCVCDPGYTGDDCGSRSCLWDCGEGGRCVDGRCVCWPGYAGEDCSTRTCPRDCRGRGRCEDGECICDAGYSGDDCGVRSCPGDCNQRGRCEDGRCVCWPGYTGPDCGSRACPRDCRGRGRCENGVCVCNAGYSGEDCGVRSCPGDCRGRGRCESGRCVCWPGYTGRDCGTRACPGDCRGRGRCVDGRCVCNPGFAGEDCGSRRCPGDCRGRGRCEDGVCVCNAGYEGEDCGVRSCPGGCHGRGQCHDGRCVCDDDYSGEDCSIRRCPRDCSQHGVCQDGVCTCWEGYAGEDCGLRTCPSNCHQRGRCEDGRCVCNSGYTGPSCATRTCPADCRGRGRCVQGVCVCHVGYSGEDCGQEEPPASACPGGCGPRELCRAGQCVCVEGFRGPDCAIQMCPGDCRGRGECREGSCICQEGYAGEDCGEEVPAIEGMRMHLLEETTVRTEWTRAPGTVDAYEIQFIPTTEGVSPPFTARVPSSASAYDQRGLAPGQEYQVTVRALRGTSWGPPASKTITTMIDGPQDLRVVAVTPTTLELSWLRPQAEVDRFVVSYVSAGNQRVRLEVPPEADGTVLTDLMPGVEYVVTVTAERGRAVSYPASVRANTAPGHYSYPEVRPPAPSPKPRPRPASAPRPARPARPSRPAEEGEEEPGPGPSLPQPPRRAWGNLTGELGRFRGTVQDLERHLRAHGYPLRANQTYASVARHIHEYLQRRRAAAAPVGPPAPSPRRPHPTASPDPGTWKRDSNQGIYGLSPEGVDRVAAPRHPKPEVLGSSADGSLLVSLDGLRGHFERVVLRWRPQPPAEGPGGELTVPGTTRTVSLPDLRSGTTYHVEVHGVRAGQTSKSYAFITTTGSSPSGLLGATDEPPPSGPSTTQGVQAPELQQRPQELGELRVLGRDKTGKLRVAWTAQPDTFAHFQLRLRVPEGPGVHEELLPGDVRQALVPSPPPGVSYELSLRGVPPEGEPSAPLIYQSIMDRDGAKPGKPLAQPRLGELMVTDPTSNSLLLHWTVPEGEFDSFVIQYKDRDGPQVVPVEGSQRSARITNLDVGRKYKFVLYGLLGKKRHGPLVAEAKILPQSDPSPATPPRLGKLWVTDPTPDSLRLSWTVPEGQFDSFVVQYRNRDGQPQVMPVEGPERSVIVSSLDPNHKYRFTLFGVANKKRHGPLTADGTTASESPVQPLLGELSVTQANPDSLRLAWTVPQGSFDSFVVQYKDAQGQPQVVPVRGDENEVTIPGLEPHRKYKMNLYGLHGRQRVGPVSVVATTAPQDLVEETPSPTEPSTEAPEPPEEPLLGELTVTGSSPDSLSLSWTVPQGHFDSFTVQYKDGDGRPQVVRVRGDENEVTVRSLEPGRRYKMHLYGLHGGQRQGPVSTVGITENEAVTTEASSTVAPEPPTKPRLGELAVTDATSDSLHLSWTVPEGQFDHFLVQYKNGDGQPKAVRVPGYEEGVTVSGLQPDHKYKMNLYGFHGGQRVGPVSAIGVTAAEEETPALSEVEETPSPTEPSTEAPEPPEEPLLGELTVTGSSPDSLSLSWTVPQGHFDSFTVQYKDGDGRPQVVRVRGDEKEVTVRGLEPGRRYKMHLYGLHEGQRQGPVSTMGITDPEEEPSTSTLQKPHLGELTVTDATPDSLHLSWTIPEGQFDHFLVQYKNGDGQPKAVRVPGNEDQVTVSGLQPDHKYKMNLYGFHRGQRVGPVSAVGLTAPGKDHEMPASTDLPTLAPEPPTKPRLGELAVTNATSDSLHLSWTIPEGQFDHFLVQYKNGDGQPKAVRVPGYEEGVTVSGLQPDHKYKMNLYGFHSGQRVGPVSAIGVTAAREETPALPEVEETPSPTEPSTEAPEPPEEPLLGELTVTGSSPDSLSLSWTVPQGHFDSFTVQYKDGDGRPQVVRVGGDENEVTVGGLEPGRRYKMHLYGLHRGQRQGPMSTVGVTAPQDFVEETPSPKEPSTEAPEPIEEPLLGELTVTGSSPDSLSLSWTVPQGHFDSFTVQYKDGDGRPQVVRIRGDENDVTVGGLEPGRRYKMHLYGLHGGQRQGPVSTMGVTENEAVTTEASSTVAPEPPTKPRLGELAVTDATSDSLHLSWTVPEGQFDHFLVQYKNGDGQPKAVRVPGYEEGVTVSGLQPDHKYKMNLYGFHGGQRVGPVSAIGVTAAEEETPALSEVKETPSPTEPSTEAPEPPEEPLLGELTVTGSSPDSLSLSWTVPQGHFDSFTVQYKDGDGRPQVVHVRGDENEVTVGGLEPGRRYKMHLYGLHRGQRQGPVSTVGITGSLPTEPPVAPRLGELAVAAVTSDTVSLSWSVAQGLFDSFLVQYKDAQGQPQVMPVGGHLHEITVPGLDPARKYKFLLFGLRDGKRLGPVSAEAKTISDMKSPRLGELTVTYVTPDSMTLSWTVPEGEFDSFVVQYKDRDGQPRVVPVATDQREVTIPGLEPGRKYKFLLYGLAGRKRLGPISADGTTATLEKERQRPPRLGELTVTDGTPDSLRLSWTVAQGTFDSFVVQYRDPAGQPQAVPAAKDQREVTIEGLEPGRKYKFLLYGLHGGQRQGPVSVLGVTAPEVDTPGPWHPTTEAPEPPSGPQLQTLAVSDITPDSLRLSWSVAQGSFDSFVVQYQDTDGQPQALLMDGNQNKVQVSGLEPSTSYTFFLYGLHEGKRLGPVSAEGTTGPAPAGLTPGETGPRLSQLSVTDVTTSSLRLNWEAPSEAFDSFLLRFGVPSPSTLEPHPRPLQQRELTVPGSRRSAVLRDLRPGTLYSLTLYGLRGPHKADSIQGTARTLSPVLESPRDLQFSEIGETSAQVSWIPPASRVDSFKVSYQLADGGEPQSVQVDGRARTQKLKGLIPGSHYEVTVVSVRGFEESEPLTGFLTTVPDGPTQLRALNLTEGSALLHWKAPQTPVDKYKVRVTASGAPSLQGSAPGSAVEYPLSGLELHTNYTATVRGLRGPNLTAPASVTFTTGLEAPQDLEAKEVTPRTALLTWTEPQVLPTGYLLSFNTPGEQTQEILLPGGVTSHRLLRLFPSTPYSVWLRAMWGESLTPPVSTSFTTGGLPIPFPRDCGEEMQNGASSSRATTIFLNGNRERPLDVFCDMETDGGGWLVFQRRMDGQTDFWRDWEDYAHGFGNISGEFWLGNEALHSLTAAGDYSMRVDLRAGDEAVFAQYDSFRVDSAADYYRLHLDGYHGTAGDSMSYHSGSVFSARDRDPNNLLISCAVSYRGAWWYKNCHYANLNGLYGSTVDHQGVSWYYWKGFEFSVPFTEMKLRPRSYRPPTAQRG
ncbi:tenascin-X isoform X10 [Mustela erminea]|uniref:tenascin-X isoform X10 n=1 Tax=Mustela erminea TaxID=36723 RepID=UPI0013868597|nr:tenascin-X isoform X10 [Mustela erminea]